MKKLVPFLILGLLFAWTQNVSAVTIETDKFRLGINGYINSKYTYMSEMAMQMGSMIMEMDDMSTFETDANLILNAVKDNFRANLNLELLNAVSIEGQGGTDDDQTKGKLNLLEVFGQYSMSETLQFRAGQFLSPFGIYNQIRFVTPLYAPVVLPFVYQPPGAFPGHPLIPGDANAMVFGDVELNRINMEYYFYVGNGEQASTGKDTNRSKGYGTRVRASFLGKIKAGGSFYSVENDPATEGKHYLYGTDLDITLNHLNLQGEFVFDDAEKSGDRMSYYGRMTYHIYPLSPFIGYDFIEDKSSILFTRGQERFSIGTGFRANSNIILKAEYHYHRFRNSDGFMGVPDDNHMFRTAAIFIF